MPPSAELPMLDDTFGAMLVGTFVGLILYGMVILQSFRYLRMYPEDGPWQKGWVLAIFLLETFHMVLCTHICYHYVITSYRTPGILLTFNWSLSLLPILTGAIVAICQSFFAWRIFLLQTRYRPLPMIIGVLLLGELGFFTAATVDILGQPLSQLERFIWLISVATGIVIISDLLMTTMLVMILRNSRTGIKRMDLVIDVLTLYAINTGLLTSIVSFCPFIFSLIFRQNLIFGAFGIVASKLYANAVLASLNARKSLRYTSAMLEDGLTIPLTPRGVAIPRTNTSTSTTFLVDSP